MDDEQHAAAQVVQAAWRGYVQRKDYARTLRAVVRVQAYIRGWLQKRDFEWMLDFFWENEDTVIYLQSLWRGYKARKLLKQLKAKRDSNSSNTAQKDAAERAAVEEASATRIQAAYRGFSARKTYAAEKEAKAAREAAERAAVEEASATRIQAAYRGFSARKTYAAEKEAKAAREAAERAAVEEASATRIQAARSAAEKEAKAAREAAERAAVEEASATRIQAAYRGFSARKTYAAEKEAKAAREAAERAAVEEASATRIQAACRGFSARKTYAAEKEAKAAREAAERAAVEEASATRIQTYAAEKEAKATCEAAERAAVEEASATRIQAAYRGFSARKTYAAEKEAKAPRTYAAEKEAKAAREAAERAAVEEASATRIQAAYRGFSARKTYAAEKEAKAAACSEYIEVSGEELSSMLQQLSPGDTVDSPASPSQSRSIHNDGFNLAPYAVDEVTTAVIMIQRHVRGFLTRKLYNNLRLQPDVNTVKRFLHVLTQSSEDCALDVEVQKLKSDLIVKINSLAKAEEELKRLDEMIAAIIKNQTGLGQAAAASQSIARSAKATRANMESSAVLDAYGGLLYVLQTQPRYWEAMLRDNKPGYLHYLLDVCFNRGSSAREEALLLKVYRHVLSESFWHVLSEHRDFDAWCDAVLKDPRVAFVSQRFMRSLDGLAVSGIAPIIRAWLLSAEDADIIGTTSSSGGGGGGGGMQRPRTQTMARNYANALYGMPEDVRGWTVGDVGTWLKKSKRAHVAPLMFSQDINGERLLALTSAQLGEIGIRDMETMSSLAADLMVLQDHDTRMHGARDGDEEAEDEPAYYTLAKEIVSCLIHGWKRLPFSLCFLLREAHDFMKAHFGQQAHGTLIRFVGRLFVHTYVTPLLTKGVLVEYLEGTHQRKFRLTQEQSTNLLTCCDILEHALLADGAPVPANKPEDVHRAFTRFCKQHSPKLVEVTRRICQVRSLDDYYGVDEYSDIVTLSEMCVYVSPGDMLNLHQMVLSSCTKAFPTDTLLKDTLSKLHSDLSERTSFVLHSSNSGGGDANANANSGSRGGSRIASVRSKLRPSLRRGGSSTTSTSNGHSSNSGGDGGVGVGNTEGAHALSESPLAADTIRVPKTYELGFEAAAVHTPVVVRLKVFVQQSEDEHGSRLQKMMAETKKKVIDLLRMVRGRTTLKSVLYDPISPREEMAHRAFTLNVMKNTRLTDQARRSTLSKIGARLSELQAEVRETLEAELIPAGLVSPDDDYNAILAAIVKDIREHALLRRFRRKEKSKLEASRVLAETKQLRVEQRVAFYEEYIEQCRVAFGDDSSGTGVGSGGSGGSALADRKKSKRGRPGSKRRDGGVSVNVQPSARGGSGVLLGGPASSPASPASTSTGTATSASATAIGSDGAVKSVAGTPAGVVVQGATAVGGSGASGIVTSTNASSSNSTGGAGGSGGSRLFGKLRRKHTAQAAAKALAKNRFGTHQYSGQKLKSKGVLVEVHNASRPLKEMTFEFTSYEAGVYTIIAQLHRGLYERSQVTWDDLDAMLQNGNTELTSIEGCELNVKELMALLKKKFQ
ncbi:hypothetical protein PTSG_05928 [Salpingoeca rosetta]|uniref:SAM domain-containing protein n=1 Tax=Salpingoeca rosetta (strain ATCC 50818 / BSB-021) TaxID=946362 RepID=F2UD69_SALR5|nr:uncharacterized protein PTSG_05928 [Salpingoeca rosetta]EGD74564.1 hypothetical protein PTSG_05928 [Salpingoeca rosetta]|eukprot:XP_004992821.1 hypothetical protein PTSG_05928 [Salpingoeca rosetta]